ncbi:MAG: hypothetical protein WDM90_25020 [Ferruginibacter sp.]
MFVNYLVFAFFSAAASAQFKFEWKKKIAHNDGKFEMQKITCIKKGYNKEFVCFTFKSNDKIYPAINIIDSLNTIKTKFFIVQDPSSANYEIVSVVELDSNNITAVANDYTQYNDGEPVPRIATLKFKMKGGNIISASVNKIAAVNVDGIKSVKYLDYYKTNDGRIIEVVQYAFDNKSYVNVYETKASKKEVVKTFQDATGAAIWFAADDRLVLSVTTPFSFGSKKNFYEVVLLDYNDLSKTIRKYPDVRTSLDSNATDEVLEVRYNAEKNVGFVARKVRSKGNINFANWFAFNGLKKWDRNKMIGENTDVITVPGVEHPISENILYSYSWPNSGINNWVVSVDTADKQKNELVFSIDDMLGKQRKALKIGNPKKGYGQDLESAHAGIADVNAEFSSSIKFFSRENEYALYIIANLKSSGDTEAGIYLLKWSIDPSAIPL